MKWEAERPMKVLSDLTDETKKSTLSAYDLFLMKFSRGLCSGLVDQLMFLREEDLPTDVKHHPTKTVEELEKLNVSLTQLFYETWQNQNRTEEQVEFLITEQFRIAESLFNDVKNYHLRVFKELRKDTSTQNVEELKESCPSQGCESLE
jgi:hypothetical protein